MRSRISKTIFLLGILLSFLCPPVSLRAQSSSSSNFISCEKNNPRLAVQEILAANFLVNRFNLSLRNKEWARVNFETWSNNLNLGWEWDENSFSMNMFAHPFHGSQYFNAGRANCLSYWESIPLVFFGSWTWEYFGETHRPSFNDFFMTSFGGIALGEMTHRVSAIVRDNRATGTKRAALELSAFIINPIGGISRLLNGEWRKIGPNPPERDPGAFFLGINSGVRFVYEDSVGVTHVAPTLMVHIEYGDHFDTPYNEPFDVFSVQAQISTAGDDLNKLQASGRLFQTEIPAWFGADRNAFVVSHHFDYLNNPVYRYGAQGVEIGIISRYALNGGYALRTLVASDLVVLGAIDAPAINGSRREYDFGPSISGEIQFVLEKNGKKLLSLLNRAEYLHSVSGTPANHFVAYTGLEADLPFSRDVGVGFRIRANTRESRFESIDKISRQFLEAHFFLAWTTGNNVGEPR